MPPPHATISNNSIFLYERMLNMNKLLIGALIATIPTTSL
jgi:hypothetical protein